MKIAYKEDPRIIKARHELLKSDTDKSLFKASSVV